MGNAVGAAVCAGLDVGDPEHTLQRLFVYDSPALESMWAAVHSGQVGDGGGRGGGGGGCVR